MSNDFAPTSEPHQRRSNGSSSRLDSRLVRDIPTVFVRAMTGALRELELRNVGRTLMLSLGVGLAVGGIACLFFWGLHVCEFVFLHRFTGYVPLLPGGERRLYGTGDGSHLVAWALVLVPALGGIVTGLIGHFLAPEILGGGGNSYVEALHTGGVLRKRVLSLKVLASLATLGTGGSGGREGPTMLIGASVGSLISRWLHLPERDRRILLVAGTAGGLAAMFGTPLGAGLLATEVLYRDDFESDALIPAILSSVTAFSFFRLVFPSEGHLFTCAPHYEFEPLRLGLYAALALFVAIAGRLFIHILEKSKKTFSRFKLPRWLTPALGGLLLGLLAFAWIGIVNPYLGLRGRGIGILGSGYGAAQAAILQPSWMPKRWDAVGLLLGLALVKMVATALTLESGGSAGDFGPSIAIGGMLGGAFGQAAQIILPSIHDPGAFALVGMGAFYGGIAHAPLAALVMVCEMAGSYDLLVPLMTAVGLTYLVLRPVTLYRSQRKSRSTGEGMSILRTRSVAQVYARNDQIHSIISSAPLSHVLNDLLKEPQPTFPVVDKSGAVIGVIPDHFGSLIREEFDPGGGFIAADVMLPDLATTEREDLESALSKMVDNRLHALPVVNETGSLLGLLFEHDITRAYCELQASKRASTV